MRALCLLLLCVASGARGQVPLPFGEPDCVYPGIARLLARGVAWPTGYDAISTDGFGVRIHEASGAMANLRTASILDDAVLAWRPTLSVTDDALCSPLQQMTQGGSPSFVRVSGEVGNETGDPGPLRYLDPSLPNVDKIGPDYEALVRFENGIELSGRWRDFLPTDPAIAPRIFEVVDGRFPKRKGLALAVGTYLGLHPVPLRVAVDALGAEDLPFEPTLGREIPVRRQRLRGHAEWYTGSYRDGWSGDLSLRGERLDRPEWSSLASGIGPDWQESIAEAHVQRRVELPGPSPAHRLTLGGTLRQRQAAGAGLTDGSVTWAEVGASLIREDVPEVSARLSAGPSGVGGEASLKLYASDYIREDDDRSRNVDVHAYLRRTLPEAQPDLYFWVARGYSGLASAQTPLALEGAPAASEHAGLQLTLDGYRGDGATGGDIFVGFHNSLSGTVTLTAEARRGENELFPQFDLAPEATSVSGPVRAMAVSGAVANAQARIVWRRGSRGMHGPSPVGATTLVGWVDVQASASDDREFRAARDREPTVRAGLFGHHSPDGNLDLNARLEWRAATRWEGWPEPDVPAALLLDLGLERSFVDGHYTVALTGRNVLGAAGADAPPRRHASPAASSCAWRPSSSLWRRHVCGAAGARGRRPASVSDLTRTRHSRRASRDRNSARG